MNAKVLSGLVVVLLGAFLIIAGVYMVFVQLEAELRPGSEVPTGGREIAASSESIKVSTDYVGVELVAIGAVLEIAALISLGAFTRKPAPS